MNTGAMLVTKNLVCSPYVWDFAHINNMFKILSEMPPAKTARQISNQVRQAFDDGASACGPNDRIFMTCPKIDFGATIKSFDIILDVTTKEFFLFGKNGSLEVRKLGMMTAATLASYLDKHPLRARHRTFCYAKAGANGCDPWGKKFSQEFYMAKQNTP